MSKSTEMQPPTSYQVPKDRDVSFKTPPRSLHDDADKKQSPGKKSTRARHSDKPATKITQPGVDHKDLLAEKPVDRDDKSSTPQPVCEPILHRTRPQVHIRCLNPLVDEWNESMHTLRTNRFSSAEAALTSLTAQHNASVTTISESHAATISALASQAEKILNTDLAAIQLSFTDINGAVKGTSTLGQRMELFAARIEQARCNAERISAERAKVRTRLETLCARLMELVDGDGGCDADGTRTRTGTVTREIDNHAAALKVEINELVASAVQKWTDMEDGFRRKRARNGASLARVYQDHGYSQSQGQGKGQRRSQKVVVKDSGARGGADGGVSDSAELDEEVFE